LINKLSIVEEEADESMYYLELLEDSALVRETKLTELKKDMNQVVAMIVASIKTLRSKQTQIQNLKSKI